MTSTAPPSARAPRETDQRHTFLDNAHAALQDPDKIQRRDIMALFTPIIRDAAMNSFGHFEELRQHVKQVKQHTLTHLDHYLARFEQQALHNGNHVHFADDGDQMNSIVLDICQQHSARRIAKGKSMVTEETGLNDFSSAPACGSWRPTWASTSSSRRAKRPVISSGPPCTNRPPKSASCSWRSTTWERDLAETADMVAEARRCCASIS